MSRFLGLFIILSLPFIVFLLYTNRDTLYIPGVSNPLPLLIFNNKTPLRVTVVSSGAEVQRGLSGKDSLPQTEGMLSIFPKSDYWGIWMKDMRFTIDIIWVNEAGVIVDIAEAVRPDTYPKSFEPRLPARYVIETNEHFAESFNIKIGDVVALPARVVPSDLRK